jgi:hypothetical protein
MPDKRGQTRPASGRFDKSSDAGTIIPTMRATDISRFRRRKAALRQATGPRLLRAAAMAALGLALLGVLLAGAAAAAGAFVARGFLADLPDVRVLERLPATFVPSQGTTEVVALEAGGRALVIDRITDPRLEADWLAAGELPPALVAATLALEGPQELVDALIRQHLRDGRLAPARDVRRLLQDRVLARQIDATASLEQVLEWTLNTRYYGGLAYGADAAARLTFGKPAAELSVGEAALIAALGRNPAAHPFDDPPAARAARSQALGAMVAAGFLSPAQAEAAAAEPLLPAEPPAVSFAPEFARLLRRELAALVSPERLLRGGLTVETTLDPALQRRLACATASPAARDCPAADPVPARPADAAALALDPATGEIRALAGDPGPRQLGTLIRPFIYLTALSQGYSAATPLLDLPQTLETPDGPATLVPEAGEGRGPLRLRQALAQDRAVPAAQLLSWVGQPLVVDAARTLGLTSLERPPGADLRFAAEGGTGTLLEVGRAFATLANGGREAGVATGESPTLRPTTLRRIRDAGGAVLFENSRRERDVLAPALAYLMNDILSDGEARCAAPPCEDTPASATALASGESALTRDAWAVAYTPAWALVVSTAGAAAEPVRDALLGALHPAAEWQRPPALREVEVCALSGLLPSRTGSGRAGCDTVRERFIAGTEPVEEDASGIEVTVNRETGRLATYFSPPRLVEPRPYTLYPPETAAWAAAQGEPSPPADYDTVRRAGEAIDGRAAITSPAPWQAVNGIVAIKGLAAGDGFAGYRLAYFPDLVPDELHIIAEGTTAVPDAAVLAEWDTSGLDGLYTLLLTVFRQDGQFDEIAVPVSVQDANS